MAERYINPTAEKTAVSREAQFTAPSAWPSLIVTAAIRYRSAQQSRDERALNTLFCGPTDENSRSSRYEGPVPACLKTRLKMPEMRQKDLLFCGG